MNEREIVRELARQYAEIANNPINEERMLRMRKTNDLVTGLRPTVLISEIPWNELNFDGSLTLQCTDHNYRSYESFFRRALYSWEHFQVDMVAQKFYPIMKSYTRAGIGLDVQENTLAFDDSNHIVSHQYVDILDDYDALEKMQNDVITPTPEVDNKKMDYANETFGDILPASLRATHISFPMWDTIARMRGVENIYYDIMDRTDFLHAIAKKFSAIQWDIMDQMEKHNLIGPNPLYVHQTPALTSDLPDGDSDKRILLKDAWFRGTAQMFASVSPEVHKELELDYIKPLAERCGLTYYGCCEPLDNKIVIIKDIANLRKIGVSAWAKVESSAEQIGSDYVFARKPNPAHVAADFDEAVVTAEIEETVKACIKHNCPYELVLKDISTVSYKPENLINWAKTVNKVLDKYYK